MPTINRAFKEISCKIVYYGPGLGGKTTNLQVVHKQIPGKHRGELVSLATEQDRTLFFDFLPLDLGEVKGFKTKFQLYTVPGQVFYNATRKLVLRGVDGLVFVADSQVDRIDDNIESLNNLDENLQEYGLDIDVVPLVLQYNKRDLPNISSVEDMSRALNPTGKYKVFESVACDGVGVKETLKAVSGLVLARLNEATKAGRPGAAQQSKLAEAAAKRKAAAAAASAAATPTLGPEGTPGSLPGSPPLPNPGVPQQGRPQPISAPAAPLLPPAPTTASAVMRQVQVRFREEGKVYWRGFPIGTSSLEFAERDNSDNRGDFQLSGLVKGLFRKRYWFKMLEKVPPPPGCQSRVTGFEYYRERDDSRDRNPRVEAWFSMIEPKRLYVRMVDSPVEISPRRQRLRQIL